MFDKGLGNATAVEPSQMYIHWAGMKASRSGGGRAWYHLPRRNRWLRNIVTFEGKRRWYVGKSIKQKAVGVLEVGRIEDG